MSVHWAMCRISQYLQTTQSRLDIFLPTQDLTVFLVESALTIGREY